MADLSASVAVPVRAVVAAQLRLLTHSMRWVFLIAAALGSIAAARTTITSIAVRVGSHSYEFPWVIKCYSMAIFIGLLWPGLVWLGEPPSARLSHRVMPVAHGMHDLARVIAGGCWLIVAIATIAVVGTVLDPSADVSHPRYNPVAIWGAFAVGPLLAYLIASVFALVASRYLLWFAGATVIALLIDEFASRLGLNSLAHVLDTPVNGAYGIVDALSGILYTSFANIAAFESMAQSSRWLPAAIIWLTAAATALSIVALRNRR